MTPDNFSKRSAFNRVGMYLVFLAILGVAGGGLVYTSVMQYLGWSVKPGEAAFSVSLSTRPTLWLYRSPFTERYFYNVGGNYSVLVNPWLEFAEKSGIRLQETRSLDGLPIGGNNVLVLPSAVALDAAERQAILRYRESGGAVLLTWATGSRGAAGEWLGWDFTKELTGIQISGDVTAEPLTLLTVGEGLVTHAYPAGSQLVLTPVTEKPLELEGGHVVLVSSGAKFGVTDAQRVNPSAPSKGVWAVNELGVSQSSRVAVMGMAETSWEQYKGDMHTLLGSLMEWLIRLPKVLPSQWPDGQRASAFLAVDVPVDASFDELKFKDELRQKADSGSLFFNTQRIPFDIDIVGWDKGFWLTSVEQMPSALLALSERRANRRLTGLHVPHNLKVNSFDQAVFDAGGRYRLGGASQMTFMPTFAPVNGQKPGQRMVLLPSAADASGNWMALALGGVEVFRANALDAAVPASGSLLRQPPATIWVSSAEKVTNWWVERERFQLKIRYLGSRAEIDLSVIGNTHFDGGAMLVLLPYKGRLPTIKGLKSGMPTPVVSLLDEYKALIRFDRLAQGNYSYQLTY